MGKKRIGVSVGGSIFLTVVVVLVAVIVLNMNKSTGDVKIGGVIHYTGLKCIDHENEHILFSTIKPLSWSNVVTANFADSGLSSITYQYDGIYSSEAEATRAEEYAVPNYNIILERDYGEKNNIFSHSFLKDGNKLALTITGKGDRINVKTAPYFMLSNTETFPETVDSMKSAYERVGFSCEIFD